MILCVSSKTVKRCIKQMEHVNYSSNLSTIFLVLILLSFLIKLKIWSRRVYLHPVIIDINMNLTSIDQVVTVGQPVNECFMITPLLFIPFHLVQNTLDHLIGLSSARSAPALVRYPCYVIYYSGQTDGTAISIGFLWCYLSVQSYRNRFILIDTIEPIISFF